MATTVYHYPQCSTCRKALKWLDERGIAHARVNIVEDPPSAAHLKGAVAEGVPLRGLFNVSGQSYRNGNYKEKLATMTEDQAIASLHADGKLIKRPFLVSDDIYLVGFDEKAWKQALG
ncbi:MAG TPA: Spx/MgsR family RNA polymerase-binding regulatory protein [Polyangiales bacterium]|nr:Spx/MgsR family RNA polymerase-binding regulatory protein [Polyangiales bacterium]